MQVGDATYRLLDVLIAYLRSLREALCQRSSVSDHLRRSGDGPVVVAVPDERWGEASVVVCAGDAARHPDATARVRAAVEAALGKIARPRAVIAVDAVPMLASGKPDRVALRALPD